MRTTTRIEKANLQSYYPALKKVTNFFFVVFSLLLPVLHRLSFFLSFFLSCNCDLKSRRGKSGEQNRGMRLDGEKGTSECYCRCIGRNLASATTFLRLPSSVGLPFSLYFFPWQLERRTESSIRMQNSFLRTYASTRIISVSGIMLPLRCHPETRIEV